ncbi:MAG: DUF1285 domain-containing protein [Congregibacter sp.]
MAERLQRLVSSIVSATAGLPDAQTLASWSPPLSGVIDIEIARDGRWFHNGDCIQREGLVRLFASLLRREADGEYYLLTPAEKWRIRVERHALQVIDCECSQAADGGDVWQALLNTGGRCSIDANYKLHVTGEHGEPFMDLPSGLSAQLTRPAWYRLIEAASVKEDCAFIISNGFRVDLGSAI